MEVSITNSLTAALSYTQYAIVLLSIVIFASSWKHAGYCYSQYLAYINLTLKSCMSNNCWGWRDACGSAAFGSGGLNLSVFRSTCTVLLLHASIQKRTRFSPSFSHLVTVGLAPTISLLSSPTIISDNTILINYFPLPLSLPLSPPSSFPSSLHSAFISLCSPRSTLTYISTLSEYITFWLTFLAHIIFYLILTRLLGCRYSSLSASTTMGLLHQQSFYQSRRGWH